MEDLRGAASVALNFITGDRRVVPVTFGRSFNVGRNWLWNYEGMIGVLLNVEPVLNAADANFSMGRATVFNGLLAELGLIPRIDRYITYKEGHYQVVDLLTEATFAIVQRSVITAAQTIINKAVTVSDNFSGIAQWAYFRDELA